MKTIGETFNLTLATSHLQTAFYMLGSAATFDYDNNKECIIVNIPENDILGKAGKHIINVYASSLAASARDIVGQLPILLDAC
jgi:hypothetical protein